MDVTLLSLGGPQLRDRAIFRCREDPLNYWSSIFAIGPIVTLTGALFGPADRKALLPLHKKVIFDPTVALYQTRRGFPVDQILRAYHSRPDRFNQEPVKQ